MAVEEVCLVKSEGLKDRFLVPVTHAEHFYQKGATWEFDFAERFFPGLQKVIDDLHQGLSIPSGTADKSILYFFHIVAASLLILMLITISSFR